MMVLSGWALLRIARRLTSFSLNQHPTRQPPHPADETAPLTVYVWTPIGAAKDPRRRYIVDRYIAAVDNGGNISTGHAALALAPDVYISHYPLNDISHSVQDFRQLLHAGEQNNVDGRFVRPVGRDRRLVPRTRKFSSIAITRRRCAHSGYATDRMRLTT